MKLHFHEDNINNAKIIYIFQCLYPDVNSLEPEILKHIFLSIFTLHVKEGLTNSELPRLLETNMGSHKLHVNLVI